VSSLKSMVRRRPSRRAGRAGSRVSANSLTFHDFQSLLSRMEASVVPSTPRLLVMVIGSLSSPGATPLSRMAAR